MKKFSLLLLYIVFSVHLFADPHSIQVLHPYSGNAEYFQKEFSKYTTPVSVEVNKFDGDFDDPDELYIYIYIINEKSANRFTLDISCNSSITSPIRAGNTGRFGNDIVISARKYPRIARINSISADPVLKNPVPRITWQNRVTWKLQTYKGQQVMWFYSSNPPTNRAYYLDTTERLNNDGSINNGTISHIQGPSCNGIKPLYDTSPYPYPFPNAAEFKQMKVEQVAKAKANSFTTTNKNQPLSAITKRNQKPKYSDKTKLTSNHAFLTENGQLNLNSNFAILTQDAIKLSDKNTIFNNQNYKLLDKNGRIIPINKDSLSLMQESTKKLHQEQRE